GSMGSSSGECSTLLVVATRWQCGCSGKDGVDTRFDAARMSVSLPAGWATTGMKNGRDDSGRGKRVQARNFAKAAKIRASPLLRTDVFRGCVRHEGTAIMGK